MTEKSKLAQTILAANKNVILTGAPGTGKTYVTSEIAVAICDGADKVPQNRGDIMKRYKELIKAGQIAFTTFHQSLDYEEFVEGLKPSVENGNVIYSVENGIFKNICEKAIKNLEDISKTQEKLQKENYIQKVLDDFLTDAIENETEFEYDKRNGGKKNKFTISEHSKNEYFYANISDNKSFSMQIISKNDVIKVLENMDNIKKATDINKLFSTRYKYQYTFIFQILERLRDKINGIDGNLNNPISKIQKRNYILIIDEINRGNISKIFGELITLLEKDKRLGKENEITVTLPYSQETFGAPPNLYIIGTMNTADRSIGQIDYALRRRFAFVSLQSDRSVIDNYDKYQGNAKQKALGLFDAISSFLKQDGVINGDLEAKDLMVGHSYFLCGSIEELKQRLEYEIIPLIKEYEKDGIIMSDKEKIETEITKWKAMI